MVLAIGLKLRELLRDELGLDVVMTRSTDVFIPLEERTAIANKVNADLFLSVHANAAANRNANGIETYYLNLAKTEKAAQLAAKENGTSLEKVSVLQAILFDLMANYKLNDSAHLADEVQKSLHKKARRLLSGRKEPGGQAGPVLCPGGGHHAEHPCGDRLPEQCTGGGAPERPGLPRPDS